MSTKPRCQALVFGGGMKPARCKRSAAFRHRQARGTLLWEVVHHTNLCRLHSAEMDRFEDEIVRLGKFSTVER